MVILELLGSVAIAVISLIVIIAIFRAFEKTSGNPDYKRAKPPLGNEYVWLNDKVSYYVSASEGETAVYLDKDDGNDEDNVMCPFIKGCYLSVFYKDKKLKEVILIANNKYHKLDLDYKSSKLFRSLPATINTSKNVVIRGIVTLDLSKVVLKKDIVSEVEYRLLNRRDGDNDELVFIAKDIIGDVDPFKFIAKCGNGFEVFEKDVEDEEAHDSVNKEVLHYLQVLKNEYERDGSVEFKALSFKDGIHTSSVVKFACDSVLVYNKYLGVFNSSSTFIRKIVGSTYFSRITDVDFYIRSDSMLSSVLTINKVVLNHLKYKADDTAVEIEKLTFDNVAKNNVPVVGSGIMFETYFDRRGFLQKSVESVFDTSGEVPNCPGCGKELFQVEGKNISLCLDTKCEGKLADSILNQLTLLFILETPTQASIFMQNFNEKVILKMVKDNVAYTVADLLSMSKDTLSKYIKETDEVISLLPKKIDFCTCITAAIVGQFKLGYASNFLQSIDPALVKEVLKTKSSLYALNEFSCEDFQKCIIVEDMKDLVPYLFKGLVKDSISPEYGTDVLKAFIELSEKEVIEIDFEK